MSSSNNSPLEEKNRSDREIMIEVLKQLYPDEANCCEEDLEQLIDEHSEMILTTIRVVRKYAK